MNTPRPLWIPWLRKTEENSLSEEKVSHRTVFEPLSRHRITARAMKEPVIFMAY
jgi:hypothetical protein